MRRSAIAALFMVLASVAGSAMFIMVETKKVPVERLAQNIEKQLGDKPDDTALRLNLARLYAMAYALKVTEFDARPKGGQLEAWFGHTPSHLPGPVRPASTREHEQRAQADLTRALALYQDVITRSPENFVAHIGYAWALEQASRKTDAVAEYRKVIELALPGDRKQQHIMVGQEPATIEAAARLKVLLDPVKDAKELAALQAIVMELEQMPRAITPVAIPLKAGSTAAPLDRDARVLFDADGSGIPRRWTWIEKDAGWLVYDSDGSGEITSALQWFGNVTFWLFWSNGYQALGALDDDGDGELRGGELRNLAIWRDRNQNGVSEKGEVRSLAAHGIVALSCGHVDSDGDSVAAHSPRGVTFSDGTTRPSYDVILHTTGRAITLTRPN